MRRKTEQFAADRHLRLKGNTLFVYSKKTMKKAYPGGGYEVCGEVGAARKNAGVIGTYQGNAFELPIYPLNTYGWTFGSAGYVLVDKEKKQYALVRKSRLLKIFFKLLLVLAVIACLILGARWFLNRPQIEGNAKAYDYKIEKPENWDPTKILVPGYSDWVMEAGTDMLYVALYNPDNNPCYFKFIVTRNDTGQLLYETDLVPPGSAVTEIALPEKLEKGIYDITVEIQSYALEDHKIRLNGAEVATRIVAREIGKEE